MSEPSAIETSPESRALAGGWLVNIDGDEIVEMTRVQVVASFGSGRIHEHTLIWHEGMDDWMPLVQVPAFRLLSLRESNIPESGARVKTRSRPPPKPERIRVTDVGLGPPPTAVAGSRPYGDSDSASDSVTLSREALELLSRDVLAIAEREALEVQQTNDSVTVARALLEPSLDAQPEAPPEDTSVLAVYDRPVATVEFPTGDESTPGAKLDDDPTQMRAPVVPATAPAPMRKATPVAFPPPAPPPTAQAVARAPIAAPPTTAPPRSTEPATRQPPAYVAGPIRPAAGTPALRPSGLPAAPERLPPMRNPPPQSLEAPAPPRSPGVPGAAATPAVPNSVSPPPPLPVATGRVPAGAVIPVAGPTPVAFSAQAAPGTVTAGVPTTLPPRATVAAKMALPTPVSASVPTGIQAPAGAPFRATSLPSLSEIDASALRAGRRVPLLWAVCGCLASAAVASIVTALLTRQPTPAPVVSVPVPTMEPPKAAPPLPPPPAPVTSETAADPAKAVAAPPAPEKPKRAPAAWRPRPKPKPVETTDTTAASPTTESTSAPAPSSPDVPSGLEQPATGNATPAPPATETPSTFNPGF